MKLLQSVKEIFLVVGINPPNQKSSFNWKNVLVITVFIQGFILTALFWILEAESLSEGGESFYASVIELANAICMLNLITKMNILLELIGNLERFFDKSKF